MAAVPSDLIDPLHSELQRVGVTGRTEPVKVTEPVADSQLPLDRSPPVHRKVKLVQSAALDQLVVEIYMGVAPYHFDGTPPRFRNHEPSKTNFGIVDAAFTGKDVAASYIKTVEPRVLHYR